MIDSRIKLRHLRCFLEIARLGSLSAAAQSMNVSQPAASKTLRELEDVLGKPLFDRTARRLSLTQTGRMFQQHAGKAMNELSRALTLVREPARERTRLTVGVLPTAATTLLPRAALAFRKVFPDCLLRVSTGPNWLLMSQLREGALDLVVGRMAAPEVMSELLFHQLYSEQISAIARPGHPLLGIEHPLDHLADYPLILPPPGAVIAPLVRSLLSRHDVPADAAAFETVSLAFGRRIVQESDAIWFISQGVVEEEVTAGTLATLPIEGAHHAGPVGVSMRSGGPLSPQQTGLVRALEHAYANSTKKSPL
jgi:LysR family pca operon transcriptional activator